MTNQEEYVLLKQNPRMLFDQYMSQITNGTPLTPDQLIKFEYLKTLFIKEE